MDDWHKQAEAMSAQGISDSDIARALGKHRRSVRRYLNNPIRYPRKPPSPSPHIQFQKHVPKTDRPASKTRIAAINKLAAELSANRITRAQFSERLAQAYGVSP